jgi:hypothetical protein
MYLESNPTELCQDFADSNHARQLRSLSLRSVFTADLLRSIPVTRLTT